MSHVFHRHNLTSFATACRGEGPYILDNAGRRYFDGSGGAAVSCLGHNHPAVIAAIKGQLEQLAYAHSGFFTTEAAEQLADRLIENAPGELDRVYFVSGGSEAVEAALKLARQYFVEIGQPQRRHLIARRQSYHGNTLGALSVGGNEWRREPFRPLLTESHHIAPCYAYRDQREGETPEQYGFRVANELETKILELGEDAVCAFICEPVVGATAGAVPAVPGYLKRIREICNRYDVLLIFDEVMCGMGRTGTLFACEQDGVAPDIMIIAKGLGAGYQPIGAMIASKTIYDAITGGSGFFQHGHTYMGHASACAGALAVQKVIAENELLNAVRGLGEALMESLNSRFGQHPHVGDIRGRGLFIGLEFVADRDTKTPFDAGLKINSHLKKNAMANGLICYPMGGTIDGKNGDHVLIAPPFIINNEHIDELTDKLDKSIQDTLSAI